MNTKLSNEGILNSYEKYKKYISMVGISLAMNLSIQAQNDYNNYSDINSEKNSKHKLEIKKIIALGSALHSGAYDFASIDVTTGLECEIEKIILSIEGGLSKPIFSNDAFGRTPEGRDRIIQGSILRLINEKHRLGAYIAMSSLEEKIEDGHPFAAKEQLHNKIIESGLHYEYTLNDRMQLYLLGNINNFNDFKSIGTGGSIGIIFKI